MFGRKIVQPAPAPQVSEPLLNTGINTLEHAKVAGGLYFHVVYQKLMEGGDGVSLELLLGLLASAGGVASIDTALRKYEYLKHTSDNPNLIFERQEAGKFYFIGDLPAYYLLENNNSVLCLALNAAIELGADITKEMPEDALRNVMHTVGTPNFGIPRLPDDLMPPALPLDLAALAWPQAVYTLDLAELAAEQRPAAIGFAICKAIEMGAGHLDPMAMARIVVEYAAPMAAVDPHQFPPVSR